MAAGVTQPGGAGTTIYIYDDASSASGTGYTWAEIATAFPTDFVSNGTFLPSYRSKVSVQIGDATTNSATTSLIDATDSVVVFDSGKTLAFRTTQTTSWFLTLGTKIGTGDQASGSKGGCVVCGASTTLRGTVKLYGVKWVQNTGSLAANTVTAGVCEAVNCIFQNNPTSGTSLFNIGSASSPWDNIYNVDFSNASTSGQVASSIQAATVERITVSASGALPQLILNNASNIIYKDMVMFGSPTISAVRYTQAVAKNHEFVRPIFPAGVAKFSASQATGLPADGHRERWMYDAKCVTGDGAGVSGIPIKLTDSTGEVQVNTTTDANGEISHGSGVTAESVIVADHYFTGALPYTYQIRSRSPFLVEVNLPTQSGYNPNYFSHRYYFNWPGSESVTTTSGTFADVADVFQMSAVTSGGGSTWTETTVP